MKNSKDFILSRTLPLSLILFVTSSLADVQVPELFSDHMVLQRDQENPVWGTADPDETVTATLGDQEVRTKADSGGKWSLKLKPLPASLQPLELKISGKNKLVIRDVLIGEVWLCSGQSNMGLGLKRAHYNSEDLTQSSNYPLRFFKVPKTASHQPSTNCKSEWILPEPRLMEGTSAVAYFYGKELYETLKIPIGLLISYTGNTPIEAWISLEALQGNPNFQPFVAEYEEAKKRPITITTSNNDLDPPPADARAGTKGGSKKDNQVSTVLYNAMIHPLQPYGIRGAIWYQGENNGRSPEMAEQYAPLLSTLISSWRQQWGQGDFPFLYVQLAGFKGGTNWPWLRNSQLKTLNIPATGMAVAIDIGEEKNIHPKNKKEVAHRLTLAARHLAYREDLVYSGPLYESMTIVGDKITVKFKHPGSGLCVGKSSKENAPPATSTDGLIGFEIAGSDGVFVKAEASIIGETIVAQSNKVPNPKSVRYGWDGFPIVNLYNKEGLPASPFTTEESKISLNSNLVFGEKNQ